MQKERVKAQRGQGKRTLLRSRLAALATLSLTSFACGGAVDADEDAQLQAKLELENGLTPNGLNGNGLNGNGLNGNGLNGNGLLALSSTPGFSQWLGCAGSTGFDERVKVMKYLAGCALSTYDSVSITDSCNVTRTFKGTLLNLARNWVNRAPNVAERQRVSACLLARVNAAGNSVGLSLRGLNIRVTTTEAQNFPVFEGAFFGDLFDPASPRRFNCRGDAWRDNGRRCEADPASCGQVGAGRCSAICRQVDNSSGSKDLLCTYQGAEYPAAFVHLGTGSDLKNY